MQDGPDDPPEQQRLRLLLDAVVSMASELSLDSVLSRIVEVASQLSGARYAALGVLGASREKPLDEFVSYGLSDAERSAIGDLPSGHGLLGLIIDQPHPLRLTSMADHPASYGVPPNHPDMTSFLGVPIRIGDTVFGNLYLTDKRGSDGFSEQDEKIVVALAAAAGVVIENAKLYQEAERRERWLAATAEITAALLGPTSTKDALQLVADRARETADADVAFVVLREGSDRLHIEVVSGPPPVPDMHPSMPLDRTLSGTVVIEGEAVVVEDIAADPRVSATVGVLVGWPDLGPVMMVPLRTVDGVDGLVTLGWYRDNRHGFHDVDIELPQRFAEQAALALQIARGRSDAAQLALFEERDRIARDLHDHVIQRLFAIGLGLDNTSRMANQPAITDRVTAAVDDIDATIKEIRRSIFALHSPPESGDVRAQLTEVVEGATTTLGFPATLEFDGPVVSVVSDTVQPHLVAVLRETLSNAARHADATSVDVVVAVPGGDTVELTVRDDGRGIGPHTRESGLRNLRERARDLGGDCRVTTEPGAGTTVVWSVPAHRTDRGPGTGT